MATAPCMLTTTDNPYDPFEDFTSWFMFDISKGYDCCGYVDRIAKTSNQFTDEENNRELERAIDEIIKVDPFKIYTKVYRKDNTNK